MSPRVRPMRLVGWLVVRLVGRSVGLSRFSDRAGSYTSMLLSEHLLMDIVNVKILVVQ